MLRVEDVAVGVRESARRELRANFMDGRAGGEGVSEERKKWGGEGLRGVRLRGERWQFC